MVNIALETHGLARWPPTRIISQGSVDAAQLVTFMCNGVTARLTDAGFVALRVMRYESGGGPRYALQPSWRTALRVTSMCGCCVTRYTKTAV